MCGVRFDKIMNWIELQMFWICKRIAANKMEIKMNKPKTHTITKQIEWKKNKPKEMLRRNGSSCFICNYWNTWIETPLSHKHRHIWILRPPVRSSIRWIVSIWFKLVVNLNERVHKCSGTNTHTYARLYGSYGCE